MIWRKLVTFVIPLALMLIGLPLAGVALSGQPVSPYLQFPPRTDFVAHAPFSWIVFILLAALMLACVTPFFYCLIRNEPSASKAPPLKRNLTWWTWLGMMTLALSWWLAWNRFDWFAALQEYTFSPIWLGYIVVVNGLTLKRTGECMLTHRPRYLLALFLASAVFWWFFEFLNRFVQNWHYVGLAHLNAWEYFLQATLPFSTVLPAVLSTKDFLASLSRLSAGLSRAASIRVRWPKPLAALALVIAGLGLSAIGVWPGHLYPLVWLAPLLIITSLQALNGERSIFHPLAGGDWRHLWLAALAALVCGFFWELWNYKSLAHWEYSIPYVHRFEIFNMPLLGYAGYLPFGLECLAVASLLDRRIDSRVLSRQFG